MEKSYIEKPSWVFRFYNQTFFVTSFAPCYPSSNSRFNFGAEHCYILFQPEVSFALHDIPPDTESTNWESPRTVRDVIRIAFRKAGRGYIVTKRRPLVYDIVKPLTNEQNYFEWWR